MPNELRYQLLQICQATCFRDSHSSDEEEEEQEQEEESNRLLRYLGFSYKPLEKRYFRLYPIWTTIRA